MIEVEWTPSDLDALVLSGVGQRLLRRMAILGAVALVAAVVVASTMAPILALPFVAVLAIGVPLGLLLGARVQVERLRPGFARPRRVVLSPAGVLRDGTSFSRWSAVRVSLTRTRLCVRTPRGPLRIPRERLPPDAEQRVRAWQTATADLPPPQVADGRSVTFRLAPEALVAGASAYFETRQPRFPRALVPLAIAALAGAGLLVAAVVGPEAPGLALAVLLAVGALALLLAPWWRPGRSAARTLFAATGAPQGGEVTFTVGPERFALVDAHGWIAAAWADTEVVRPGPDHLILKTRAGFVPLPTAPLGPEILAHIPIA